MKYKGIRFLRNQSGARRKPCKIFGTTEVVLPVKLSCGAPPSSRLTIVGDGLSGVGYRGGESDRGRCAGRGAQPAIANRHRAVAVWRADAVLADRPKCPPPVPLIAGEIGRRNLRVRGISTRGRCPGVSF
jgi:hypothetical protein